MKTVALRVLTWPLYLGTLLALVIRAFWGSGTEWSGGVLLVRLRPDGWLGRTWGKSWAGATFGYGIVLAATADQRVVDHELIHVEQYQALTLGGLWLGLLVLAMTRSAGGIAAALACWMLSVWACYFAATVTAWLRREPNSYRGNCFEEGAYAETEVKCSTPPGA